MKEEEITIPAQKIADAIEATNRYLKKNWKNISLIIWMPLITMIVIEQQQALKQTSSRNQVANLQMALDDIRYSIETMEADSEKMQRAVTRIDTAVKNMESSVSRIHTQLRAQP